MRWTSILVAIAACSGRTSETAIVADRSSPPPAPPADAARAVTPAAAPALPLPVFPFDAPPPNDRVVALAGTKSSNCAVRASGHVDCWGTFGDHDAALTRLAEIDDAIDVRIGEFRRCVHARRGVLCEGTFGDHTGKLEPVRGLTKVIALSTGAPSCARTEAGIACWSDLLKAEPPRPFADIVEYVDGEVSCLVQKRGGARCRASGRWHPMPMLDGARSIVLGDFGGSNTSFYQELCAIVRGDVRCFTLDGDSVGDRLTMKPLPLLTPAAEAAMHGATSIKIAGELVALVDGRVVVAQRGEPPHAVPLLSDATAITPTCALRMTGSVVCWGINTSGALGQPDRGDSRTPVTVVGVADVVSLARTRSGMWAVTAGGALFRWGDMIAGWAVPSPLGTDLVAVASDAETFAGPCLLHRDGRVRCIDRDGLANELAVTGVTALDVSRDTFSALLKDGSAVRWDWVGFGSDNGRITRMGPLPGVVELDGDASLSCRRDTAGTVGCAKPDCVHDPVNTRWDCTDRSPLPIAIPDAAELALHHGTACARTKAGEVWCWGSNYWAQVGRPDPEMDAPPRAVPGISDATGLVQEDGTFCAPRRDGRLTCWGGRRKEAPHEVLPARSVIAPVVGTTSGCFIRADRRVACWGTNGSGELGDGSVIRLDTPAAVPGL